MLLEFTRELDKGQTPAWWADFDGVKRAIGLIYSPAFGPTARVMLREPLRAKRAFTHTFYHLITARTETQHFCFTPTGFTIEVDEKHLRNCIQKPLTKGD